MAKKVESITEWSAGYNSKVSPRDVEAGVLTVSRGVSSSTPGILKVLGKSNPKSIDGVNYVYNNVNPSTDVLGKTRNPVGEPGHGIFSFASEFTYGNIGRFKNASDAFANNSSGSPTYIDVLVNPATPIQNGASDSNKIPLRVGDWIYIWGLENSSPVYQLNDRYFKVLTITAPSANNGGKIGICDWVDGANADLDITKFTLQDTNDYSEDTHGGFWRTIPEQSFTRYIITQNGECMDMYYNVVDSNNEFSSNWIVPGTLGFLANNGSGGIGKLGNDSNLNLGLSNIFSDWPQSGGINYGLKPDFHFFDNVLRMYSSNRISRPSSADTLQYSNPRWFGHIKREKLFGIDSAVTNINEWYFTEANLRAPIRNEGDTQSRLATYIDDTLTDRVSWETGGLDIGATQITDNMTYEDSKRFTDSETLTNWHNMSGNVRWQYFHLQDTFATLGTRQNFIKLKGWPSSGNPVSPLAMKNHLPDGEFRASRSDYDDSDTDRTQLAYWHSPGSGGFDNTADHVDKDGSGTNSWTWTRGDGVAGSVTKAASNTNPLYCGRGGENTTAQLTEGQKYIVTFTISGCTSTGAAAHGINVNLQGGGDVTVVCNSHADAVRENCYKSSIKLTAGAQSNEWLIKFTPSDASWVGTISDVSISKNTFRDNSIVVGIGTESINPNGNDAENGWDKAEYEFFQTFIYDEWGRGKQESTATFMRTQNMEVGDHKRKLRLSPGVIFSSDGNHYDMMDKRIVGSNIYYRRKKNDDIGASENDIMLLLEMDWVRGVKQYGEGAGDWIPWTQQSLTQPSEDDDDFSYLYGGTINISPLKDTCVMAKLSGVDPYFEWLDPPVSITYKELNGHPHDEPAQCNARYGALATVNGSTFIGNIGVPLSVIDSTNAIKPEYEYYPSKIIRCAAGQVDKFPFFQEQLRVTGASEGRIVSLYGIKDYLVVLCTDSYYILKVKADGFETAFSSGINGIKYKSQALKCEVGIIWANSSGCYVFDGEKIVDLTKDKISKDSIGWANNNDYLHYWDIVDNPSTATSGKYIPSVGYFQGNQQLIIKKSCAYTGNLDEGRIFMYDFGTQTWTTNDNGSEAIPVDTDGDGINDDIWDTRGYYSFTPLLQNLNSSAGVEYRSNFTTSTDSQLLYKDTADTNSIYFWKDLPSSNGNDNIIDFALKDVTFDKPHNLKRIYQIFLTYRCTGDTNISLSYSLDSAEGWSLFNNNLLPSTSGKWEVVPLLASNPINAYSIQVRVKGIEVPYDFQINEVTFVYRVKSVKIGI